MHPRLRTSLIALCALTAPLAAQRETASAGAPILELRTADPALAASVFLITVSASETVDVWQAAMSVTSADASDDSATVMRELYGSMSGAASITPGPVRGVCWPGALADPARANELVHSDRYAQTVTRTASMPGVRDVQIDVRAVVCRDVEVVSRTTRFDPMEMRGQESFTSLHAVAGICSRDGCQDRHGSPDQGDGEMTASESWRGQRIEHLSLPTFNPVPLADADMHSCASHWLLEAGPVAR